MKFGQEIELLAQHPMFASLDNSKLKLLAFTSEWLDYEDGEELFRQGDASDGAYLILTGNADIILDTRDGERAIARWGPGDLIGEIGAVGETPRTATVRAHGKLSVLKISSTVFRQLLLDSPQLALDVIRLLAKRLAAATEAMQAAGDCGR